MTEKAVARIGDEVTGICNAHESSVSFTGQWETGSPTVTADGIAVVRLGDTGLASCGHHFHATTASSVMTADGIAVHRVDDLIEILDAGGGSGSSTTGSPNVFSE
jgi:hypothetical protein